MVRRAPGVAGHPAATGAGGAQVARSLHGRRQGGASCEPCSATTCSRATARVTAASVRRTTRRCACGRCGRTTPTWSRTSRRTAQSLGSDGNAELRSPMPIRWRSRSRVACSASPSRTSTRSRRSTTSFAAANGRPTTDPDVERTTAPARGRVRRVVAQNIERIRREPGLLDHLDGPNSDNPELRHSDDEIVANVRIILFGAIETVTSSILSTTWALLTHPDQLVGGARPPGAVRGRRQRGAAVDLPGGAFSSVGRRGHRAGRCGDPARRDAAAEPAAANRDPSVFSGSGTFDIHRANALHHDAFGRGEHHCIGINVANLEARIAVQRLFERFRAAAGPRAAGRAHRVRFPQSAPAARDLCEATGPT